MSGFCTQESGFKAGEIVQRQYTHSVGFAETTLFHRQGWQDVQAHSQLYAEFQAIVTGQFHRHRPVAGGSQILRNRP